MHSGKGGIECSNVESPVARQLTRQLTTRLGAADPFSQSPIYERYRGGLAERWFRGFTG